MRTRTIVILVFLAALFFYLPFNANLAVTDPVESNYALPAKEMVISGDFISPQIYGHYWFDKPIMIYSLIAVCYKLFGINEFAARFPAAICSAASVAFLYWFAYRLFANRRIALFSTVVLATSLEFWVLSRMIITDAVLFLFGSVSLAAFYLGLRESKKCWYIMAYAAAGLAVLTKGPVGIVLPGLIVFVYIVATRQWKYFGKLFLWRGLAIFLMVAAPWYVIMYQRHGMEFINTFLGLHNYLRATVSEHPQDNVFYYYLVLFPVSMLPWSGLLLKALGSIKRQFSYHMGFLLTWLAGILVFYTLMATKYPTYVFPAMFPASLLIGREINEMLYLSKRRAWYWLSLPALSLFLVLAAGKLFFKAYTSMEMVWAGSVVAVVAILWLQIKGNYRRLPETVAAVTIVTSVLLIPSVLISLSEQRSAKLIVQELPASGAVVGSYGEYATSAVFYSGYSIPALVTKPNTEDKTVWSGKYTMPQETIALFQKRTMQYKDTYLLTTSATDLTPVKQELGGRELLQIAVQGDKRLYRLTKP